ncbi:MAG TPA: efflux RND transporter periplasmic adaptor subunit [Thermoanaerobaculia bacterium]|jgi:RND family efflux transporter MFP subunit|nr:efflux RND transporter periplasmic adaptor subunit [Thermoanaerobaculia bacterium]
MSRKYLIVLALAAPLSALLAGCGDDSASAAKKGAKTQDGEARQVRIVKAEESRLARTVDVSGTLAADQQATLGLKVAGRLEKILVDIGTPVRRGQAIARLVPTDFELRVTQAQTAMVQARVRLSLPPEGPDAIVPPDQTAGVRQAAATLKQAQLNLDRMKRLFDQQLIPRSDLDSAEAALGVADGRHQEAVEEARTRQAILGQRRSELGLAEQQLTDSVLTAPFDGIIRERLANAGDYVAVGAPIAVLVQIHPLRLRLAVPERDAAGIKIGQRVDLTVEGDAAKHAGRVARISPSISEDNRTLMVEAEVPNADGRLRPGSFARAEIVVLAADSAVLVPASSIVSFAGIDKVMGVEGGKAVEKRVKTGRKAGDRVEIVNGVKAGDSVVVEPGNLVSGETVRAVP